MSNLLTSLLGATGQGILWGIMALGVYITYKLLDIADLTVDGSFALGGCTCAILIINGVNPVVATVLAVGAGLLAGAVTGILHTFFNIPAILAGILTQLSLWSINLRILGGKSNLPLLNEETIISSFVGRTGNTVVETASPLIQKLGLTQSQASLVVGVVVVAIIIFIMYWFFGTEIGSALRATGNNETMIRALGVNTNNTKLLALMLSNGLVALSGAFVAQMQKYADIGMGQGAIVIALAAIIIGEVLFKHFINFGVKLISAAVGAVIYFIIRAVVLYLGLNANDMKLISAVIVALALCIPTISQKMATKKAYSEGDDDNA
ncbi:MAG: ABC transporter permease [Christensenellales bacterium]|nr:ABC transporter permease [Clostridiales bacterium]